MVPPIDINCPHFAQCSGCQQNTDVANVPIFAQAQAYFKDHGIELPPLRVGSPVGWRTRAKLAIRGDHKHPQIGLFEEGSHRIVDIPQCRVHHPSINAVVEKLKTWIVHEGISIYNESEKQGLLRYMQCSVERQGGRVQVVLVVNGLVETLKKSLLDFCSLNGDLIHSVWLNINIRHDNVIFGDRWEFICGEEHLWERLCDVSVCFHPACFCQANLDMYERLIMTIQKHVPSQSSVLEMYAGVGVIGLCLVDYSSKVFCVEITPEARLCFENSRIALPAEKREKIALHVASASSQVALLKTLHPTVLVVDPPRKGLDRSLIAALVTESSLEKIIYVSCGWPSFQKDCDLLLRSGWRLSHVEAFMFFPGTNHLEVLAIFDK